MYKIVENHASYFYKLSKKPTSGSDLFNYESLTEAFCFILHGFPGIKLISVAFHEDKTFTFTFQGGCCNITIDADYDDVDWNCVNEHVGVTVFDFYSLDNKKSSDEVVKCTCSTMSIMTVGCKCGGI